jgi:ATP-dependent Clp protease ATP-binding subunit ClpB
MTSNLGSEEIRAASPRLHKLVATTEDRHERYLKGMGQFTKQLYPVLKKSLKRDEFLGRINQIVVFLPLSNQEVSNEGLHHIGFIDDRLSSPDKSSH